MLAPFRMHEARTVTEASALLREHAGDAAFYAGGTELIVLMKDRLVEARHLVNLKTIPGLDQIRFDPDDGTLLVGALATHRAIERSPLVCRQAPVLAELAANVANVRVRCAGTIGGNLCFAEPHSDPATLLVAWEAAFVLDSADGTREEPAETFFRGLLETTRRPEEVMTEVRVCRRPARSGTAYERFKTHERPSASVAAEVVLDGETIAEARVVVGSVGERPVRLRRTEALLRGQRGAPDLLDAAAERARDEVEPTEDVFESTDYKRHLAATLTRSALAAAIARARANGGAADGA